MEFSPDDVSLTRKVTLQKGGDPGCVVELHAELDSGSEIRYSWTAGSGVEFNIHTHHEKEVKYHEQSTGVAGKGHFLSPSDGHYYLMWLNRSQQPVEVKIQVGR